MDPQPSAPDGAPRLVDLVAECLARVEQEGAAAIEAICAEHPDQAERLRARLADLRDMGLLELPEDSGDEFPERLGPFRLERRLGHGGMGVVYLAEQEPLGRQVALKVIRPDQLYFEGARERFRRELQAIARLKHPGIVPVHLGGEEDGVPYYAMEYVEGATLAEAVHRVASHHSGPTVHPQPAEFIAALEADSAEPTGEAPGPPTVDAPDLGRTWTELCLRVTLQLAHALEHAHERGVLHRDVKPSNVMVCRDGRVMLMDFGLASTSGSARITRSGSALGSLTYMSPEQVEGRAEEVDERSDVYSLGVTLYEMLTLIAPFAHRDPQVTARRILAGGPPPVRERNPSVSWDAETVCLTAMDRDPARRYATATDLARDLRNVLEHRPIEARRPGPWLRARRFTQRHPAWSVAAAAAALLFAGTVVYAVNQHLSNRSLEVANQEKDQALRDLRDANRQLDAALTEAEARRRQAEDLKDLAHAEQARAERNFMDALQAASEMLTSVGFDLLEDVPGTAELRRHLLDSADRLYTRLAEDQPDHREMRYELARLFRLMGQFHADHGDVGEGIERLRASIDTLDGLVADGHDQDDVLTERIEAFVALGNALNNMGRHEEAVDAKREALALTREHLRELEDAGSRQSTDWRRHLFLAEQNLGASLIVRERWEEGVEHLEEARFVLEDLMAETPGPDDRIGYLSLLNNLGAALGEVDRVDEGIEALRTCVAEAERFLAEDGTGLMLLLSRAYALSNLADCYWQDDPEMAEGYYRGSLDQLRDLLRQYPSHHPARAGLVHNLGFLAQTCFQQGRRDEAAELFEEASTQAELFRRQGPPPEARRLLDELEELRTWMEAGGDD